MEEKITIQSMVKKQLQNLLTQVEEGKFGVNNKFNRDEFEAAFDDEVLMVAYVYEGIEE